MAVFVNPANGERYENVPDDQAEEAQSKFGLVPLEAYEAEQRSGGVGSQILTGVEEGVRQVAGFTAAVNRGLGISEATGEQLSPGSFTDDAQLERREVNPGAAALGSTLPAVAGGLLLPGGGVLAAAGALGLDAASGFAQEAVDAELENRDIRGEDVLRNAGLNVAFSLGAMGLGPAARASLKGGRNLLERAAEGARSAARTRAGAAEGRELAEAIAEPSTRDELMTTLAARSDEAVNKAFTRLEQSRPAKVAVNPNAQRDALESLNDAFEKSDPTMVSILRDFERGPSAQRLAGIRDARAQLDDGSDLATALDKLLEREDLWGSDALGSAAKLDAALKMRPPPGASPDELLQFAGAVREARGGEFAGLADQIEQLAERAQEIRVAATLGDVPPEAATKGIDYAKAMKSLDPTEAWRLTKDGADEGMRKLEANTVSDALQRVDDTLKEDVAMSVKRQDFVKGAEKWSPAQIAKQDRFVEEMFDAGADLQKAMAASKGATPESGFALQGFAAKASNLLSNTLDRIAGADPITRNFELDQLKRGLHAIVRDLGGSKTVDQATKAFGVENINALAERLRAGLTDAELFGRNAGLQSATNDAWVKVIDPYSRVKRRLSEFLGREFGNIGVESGNVIRFNPDQVERAMQTFDRNFRKDLKEAIDGIDAMMSARQQSGLSHLDQLAAARADLQRVADGFEFSDLLRVAKSKAKEPAIASVGRRAIGGGSGAVTGAVAGGLPGAVGGAALGVAAERGMVAALDRVNLLKPGSDSAFTGALRKHLGLARSEQARLLADPAFAGTLPESLKRASLGVSEGAQSKAVALAEESTKNAQRDRQLTARLMVNPDQARRYLRLAGDVAPAMVRFQGEHETPQQAFLGYRQMLDGFARDPETMLEMLTEEFGDISDMSPKLQREMVVQATRVVAYLQQHMPGRRNVSVVYPNGTPASSMEIRQFALRFTAATDPASVSADARAGRLQKVQLDTLQALWPREYDGLRAEALQALGNERATTNTRQRLSLLFGFGSGVDPALGPRTRAVVAAARAAQEDQQTTAGGTPSAGTSKAVAAAQTPAGIGALQLGAQLTF
jgi:hypothetical protein